MKDYKKKLKEYESLNVAFINHDWGQNATNLYNQVVKLWNKLEVGGKIVIISYKKLGIKSATNLLKRKGVTPKIVGKGKDNLRMVEIDKDTDRQLEKVDTKKPITFNFNNTEYTVNAGDAIFSKTNLDVGTRFLLDVVFSEEIDFNHKKIADFGSGWGAISLILAAEFPKCEISAYEKDEGSIEISQTNLQSYSNVRIIKTDLTNPEAVELIPNEAKLDYIISNPPFHINKEQRAEIFSNAHRLLKNEGELFFLAEGNFVGRFREAVKQRFAIIEEKESGRYVVFRCKK